MGIRNLASGLMAIMIVVMASSCASVCIVELGFPPTVDCKKIGER